MAVQTLEDMEQLCSLGFDILERDEKLEVIRVRSPIVRLVLKNVSLQLRGIK